mmetsp:Transcript_38827/g.79393  ORF Transcript_38827/g.79393 Transcript_38827/m.79393 type:complete len:130 (+) Transcript_38827:1390-1779(+)
MVGFWYCILYGKVSQKSGYCREGWILGRRSAKINERRLEEQIMVQCTGTAVLQKAKDLLACVFCALLCSSCLLALVEFQRRTIESIRSKKKNKRLTTHVVTGDKTDDSRLDWTHSTDSSLDCFSNSSGS